jgi:FtsH-binding integral membrane protein
MRWLRAHARRDRELGELLRHAKKINYGKSKKMSENDIGRMVYVVIALALLGFGGWFAFFKQNVAKSLQMALIWVMIFVGLALAYSIYKG